jgi:hypothetical protein
MVTCGTTTRVIGAVTVETENGYERKNSSATTLQPGHGDDVDGSTDEGFVQLLPVKPLAGTKGSMAKIPTYVMIGPQRGWPR